MKNKQSERTARIKKADNLFSKQLKKKPKENDFNIPVLRTETQELLGYIHCPFVEKGGIKVCGF